MQAQSGDAGTSRADMLLYLTDEQLRRGIELLFFAYRDFTGDPDAVLAGRDLGGNAR